MLGRATRAAARRSQRAIRANKLRTHAETLMHTQHTTIRHMTCKDERHTRSVPMCRRCDRKRRCKADHIRTATIAPKLSLPNHSEGGPLPR